jgi:hypothetical protein
LPQQHHATNSVLYKNNKGTLELTIINSGTGSDHHETNALHQIKPKTYRFQPPPDIYYAIYLHYFERELVSVLSFLYTARYEQDRLSIDMLHKTLDRLAYYERPTDQTGARPPAFTKIVHNSCPPIDPQSADNCSTQCLLGSMLLLFPEEMNTGKFTLQSHK